SAGDRVSWKNATPPPPPGNERGASRCAMSPGRGTAGTRPSVTCSTWPITATRMRAALGGYFAAPAAVGVAELIGAEPCCCCASAGGSVTSAQPVFGLGTPNQRLVSVQV